MGFDPGIENGRDNFRRDEHVSRSGRDGDAGSGRHWRNQYHAGRGERTYARDWTAESVRSYQPQHTLPFFSGRIASHTGEWPDRHDAGGWIDGDDGRNSWAWGI